MGLGDGIVDPYPGLRVEVEEGGEAAQEIPFLERVGVHDEARRSIDLSGLLRSPDAVGDALGRPGGGKLALEPPGGVRAETGSRHRVNEARALGRIDLA